jgi:4-hydroxyphenylpyruvate dioxygenase
MPDANWENTAGLDGIEFVEYSAPDPSQLVSLFEQFGFKRIGDHKSKKVSLYSQGDVNFIINEEPDTFAAQFAQKHGPSICAVGLRVKRCRSRNEAYAFEGC